MTRFKTMAVAVAALGCLFHVTSEAQIFAKRVGEQPAPLFLPATALFTRTGEFAPVVPEHWRTRHATAERVLQTQRRRSGILQQSAGMDRCNGLYIAEADVESPVVRDTRTTAIANARAIFRGTIVSVTPGLFEGSPGSLLKIGAVKALKKDASYANVRDTLYVRHPAAAFRAGQVDYCRQTEPGAYVPAPGDQIIIFAFIEPADDNGLFVYTFADDLIIQPANGDLQIPKLLAFFRGDGIRLETIASDIRRTVDGLPHGGVHR